MGWLSLASEGTNGPSIWFRVLLGVALGTVIVVLLVALIT
jgi:hypothetical protein